MGHYVVEHVPTTLESKIRVFSEDNKEKFSTIIHSNLLMGYCRCLEDLGYAGVAPIDARHPKPNWIPDDLGVW
jgi:hypothetical protein